MLPVTTSKPTTVNSRKPQPQRVSRATWRPAGPTPRLGRTPPLSSRSTVTEFGRSMSHSPRSPLVHAMNICARTNGSSCGYSIRRRTGRMRVAPRLSECVLSRYSQVKHATVRPKRTERPSGNSFGAGHHLVVLAYSQSHARRVGWLRELCSYLQQAQVSASAKRDNGSTRTVRTGQC